MAADGVNPRPADDWIGFVKCYRETVGGLTYAQALAMASKEWKKPDVKQRWISYGVYVDSDAKDSTPGIVKAKPRPQDLAPSFEQGEVEPEPEVDYRSPPVRSQSRSQTQAPHRPPPQKRNYQEKYYQLKMKMAALGLDEHGEPL